MKRKITTMMALFTLAVIAATANAQTNTRFGGPLALFYRGQTVSTLLPVGSYVNPALSGTTSTYRTLSSGQVSSTNSLTQYTGRQTSNAGPQQPSSQTGNGLTARYDSSGALVVQWTGDTSNVKRGLHWNCGCRLQCHRAEGSHQPTRTCGFQADE
jgi:hypothetical protein